MCKFTCLQYSSEVLTYYYVLIGLSFYNIKWLWYYSVNSNFLFSVLFSYRYMFWKFLYVHCSYWVYIYIFKIPSISKWNLHYFLTYIYIITNMFNFYIPMPNIHFFFYTCIFDIYTFMYMYLIEWCFLVIWPWHMNVSSWIGQGLVPQCFYMIIYNCLYMNTKSLICYESVTMCNVLIQMFTWI